MEILFLVQQVMNFDIILQQVPMLVEKDSFTDQLLNARLDFFYSRMGSGF